MNRLLLFAVWFTLVVFFLYTLGYCAQVFDGHFGDRLAMTRGDLWSQGLDLAAVLANGLLLVLLLVWVVTLFQLGFCRLRGER